MNKTSILLAKSGLFLIPQVLLLFSNSAVNANLDQNVIHQ